MVNSSQLNIEVYGKGQPLVLLHGWGWHAGIWKPIHSLLIEKYQLFCVDLPGCGKSPLLVEKYTLTQVIELLIQALPDNAIWLGWSLGGMLAWHIAIHYPHKIAKLITVASSPKFVSEENWPGTPIEILEKFASSLKDNYHQTMRDSLQLQLRGSHPTAELQAKLWDEIELAHPHPLALLGGLDILKSLDLRNEISQVQCPALHIFGSQDRLVPVSVAEKLQEIIASHHAIVTLKTGHIPFLTQPTEFLKLL